METESDRVCSSFTCNSKITCLVVIDFILIQVGFKQHSLAVLGMGTRHGDTSCRSIFFQEWAVSPEAVSTAAEFSWLVIDVVRGESLCQQVSDDWEASSFC